MTEAEIRAEERARVCAWLRVPLMGARQWEHDALAAMIERGDHWASGQGLGPKYRTAEPRLLDAAPYEQVGSGCDPGAVGHELVGRASGK